MSEVRNLIILGSGPAGYTAAVYAARANLKPLIIEGAQSGGALMTTTEVENFPGFPDGIMGPELMDNMRKQAERFGAEFITDDGSRVDLTGDVKTVYVGETAYQAHAVILATGSAWRPLGVPGEQELLGHGVSSCATCDGFFFRGQDIVVVGGGDSAMEEATSSPDSRRAVTIIHRRDEFRASKIMAERALANEKIKVAWNTVVTEVLGADGKVVGVRVRDVQHRDEQDHRRRPGSSWRSDTTRVANCSPDRSNSTSRDTSRSTRRAPGRTSRVSSRPVTWSTTPTVRRVTAAGTGCSAALDAERYIAGLAL